jgi:hypothetical protein
MPNKRLGKNPLDEQRPVSKGIVEVRGTEYVCLRSSDGTETMLLTTEAWKQQGGLHLPTPQGGFWIVTSRFAAASWDEAKQKHDIALDPSKAPTGQICTRCQQVSPLVIHQPPQCAFTGDNFSPNNWSCRTLRILRQAANVHGSNQRSLDHALAVIPIPHHISETRDKLETHILLYWYKDRGRVDKSMVVNCRGEMRVLNRDLAESLAHYYENNT